MTGHAWIEQRGIQAVPPDERHGRARNLFAVWFAANLGILGVVFGAILAAMGLDLVQALVTATAATTVSFLLVGAVSVAGQRAGMPALVLSRRALGRTGNLVAAAVGWVSVLGWEVVTSVIGAWALVAAAHAAFDVRAGAVADTSALGVMIVASLVLGVLGHGAILRFQRFAAVGFGLLTVAVLPVLLLHVDIARVAAGHPASLRTVLVAGGILAAGTGISWVNLAPDYSRYLPLEERARSIVGWVTSGAALPTAVLVVTGYLLSTKVHGLATALDPVGPVGAALPAWISTPFLLVAAGGMLAESDLACYSSGLTLLALGVRIRRSRTVLVDGAVVCGAGLWLMIGRSGFLGPFESFLTLLATGLSAWAGVVLADMISTTRASARRTPVGATATRAARATRAVDVPGLAGFAAGSAVALVTTASPLYTGPLAGGLVGDGSFGFGLGLAVAAAVSIAGWELAAVARRSRSCSPTTAPSTHGDAMVTATPTANFAAEKLLPAAAPAAAPAVAPAVAPVSRLVLVGSILLDILVHVDALPRRGGDVIASDRTLASGGGFNVLSAASRLGLPGAYAGLIGDGAFGRQVARDLEVSGIRALIPPAAGEDTGFTVGVVEADGERTFVTAPGIESRLGADSLRRVVLEAGDAVYVSGYDLLYPVAGPAIVSWLHGLSPEHLLAVDPGPLGGSPGGPVGAVLGRVNLFSASEREAAGRTGARTPAAAAGALADQLAPGGIAVVRVGPGGCWVARQGMAPAHVPGHPAAAVDTTGAGDVHVGAMLARLAVGDDALSAARFANVAAALSTERRGGAGGPTIEAVAAAVSGSGPAEVVAAHVSRP
ncbi:MAG: PfkB family carbohydrate kinase [Actinomycetota bacterium]|nr:PfkB family carbohydrate kinase [Actinomycetota bacterium]